MLTCLLEHTVGTFLCKESGKKSVEKLRVARQRYTVIGYIVILSTCGHLLRCVDGKEYFAFPNDSIFNTVVRYSKIHN